MDDLWLASKRHYKRKFLELFLYIFQLPVAYHDQSLRDTKPKSPPSQKA